MANSLDSLKIALKIEVENQQKLTELKKAFRDLGKAFWVSRSIPGFGTPHALEALSKLGFHKLCLFSFV